MKLQMKNGAGVVKEVPTGLSWTGLFFTYIVMWIRGMIGPGFMWCFVLGTIQVIWLFTMLTSGVAEALSGGDGAITSGIGNVFGAIVFGISLLFLFKLNRWTARYWATRGFLPQGPGWTEWGPKYGIQVADGNPATK